MFLVDRNEYKRVNFSMCRQHEFYVPICCCERIYLRFNLHKRIIISNPILKIKQFNE